MKRFAARMTELVNYLPLFPGSDGTKKMEEEELNMILLHVIPKGWTKQAYPKGWDFEGKNSREATKCLSKWRSSSKSMKEEHLLK